MKSKRMKKSMKSKRMKKIRKSKRMKKIRKSKRMKPKRRKSKLSGGSVRGDNVPSGLCNHNHTIYFCKDHFDKLWGQDYKCPFWTEIHRQLKDEKSVDSNSYNDQVRSRLTTQHTCKCCEISGDNAAKECAVFRLVQICLRTPTCPRLLKPEVCGRCVVWTSI